SNGNTDTGKTEVDPVEAWAEVTINVTKLGEEVTDTEVHANGHYTGPPGIPLSVAVDPEDGTLYELKVGDLSTTSSDGVPIYNDGTLDWVTPVQERELFDGDSAEVNASLNRYFGGEYECVRDTYVYDGSAEDYKGEHYRLTELDPQWIEVEDGYKVKGQDDPGIGIMDNNDEMQVEGDHLILLGDDEVYILSSEIGQDEFTATFVDPDFSVRVLYCELAD
ncbi:MAG: hypothetical protein ABIA47_02565, partial [bacterium]